MLKIRPLRPNLAKKVRELGETPEKLASDVALIRDWLEQEPHINANPNDQFIVSYLRACRYSIEKFKRKYEGQLTLRTQHPHIFHNRDILSKSYQEMLKRGLLFAIPLSLTEDGPSVVFFRPRGYDPNEFEFEAMVGSMSPIYDVGSHDDDNYAIFGFILVIDCEVTLQQFMQANPTVAMKLLTFAQKNSPYIINTVHVINMHKMVEPFYNLVRTMVSSKTLQKVHVHRTLDTLYEFVPQKIMPKEYGGYGPSIEECNKECMRRINRSVDLLRDLDKNVTDESKRVEPLEDNNSVHGTFRQLNVD